MSSCLEIKKSRVDSEFPDMTSVRKFINEDAEEAYESRRKFIR